MLTHRVSFLQPDKGSKGIQNNPGTLRKLLIKLHFLRILVIKDSFSLVLAGLCIKGHDWCHPRVFWIVVFKKLHRLLGNSSGNAELRSLICGNFPISRNMFIYLWIWDLMTASLKVPLTKLVGHIVFEEDWLHPWCALPRNSGPCSFINLAS